MTKFLNLYKFFNFILNLLVHKIDLSPIFIKLVNLTNISSFKNKYKIHLLFYFFINFLFY